MAYARDGDEEKARAHFQSMAEEKLCAGAVKHAAFWIGYARFEEHVVHNLLY